jgi:hypothetical protein
MTEAAPAPDPEIEDTTPKPTRPMPKLERPVRVPRPRRNNVLTRHPWWTALGSVVTVALTGAVLGYTTSGGGEQDTGSNYGITVDGTAGGEGGSADPYQNTNPQGRLACAMVVTQEGKGPYKLHTYITQGTPADGAHLTYESVYKKPKTGEAHQVGPFTTSVAGEPAIPATDHGAALAAVNGQIEGAQPTVCTPAVAH